MTYIEKHQIPMNSFAALLGCSIAGWLQVKIYLMVSVYSMYPCLTLGAHFFKSGTLISGGIHCMLLLGNCYTHLPIH